MVSYKSVDSIICVYFLQLQEKLFSFTAGTLSAQSASHTSRFNRGESGRKISACFSFRDFFSRSARACSTALGVFVPSCLRTAHKIGRNSEFVVAYDQQLNKRFNKASSELAEFTFRNSPSNCFWSASPIRLWTSYLLVPKCPRN